MDKALLFIFLAVFPFGQLLGHWPIDIAVGIIFLYSLFLHRGRSAAFGIFGRFVLTAAFSYFLSQFIFKEQLLITGFMYLFRLIIYWFFLDFCINLVKKDKKIKPLLFKSLITVLAAVAVLGWIQYLFYPDLTVLKYLGWDDHLYRLAGTFLDPGFTSLFLVLGAVLSFSANIALPIFFIFSLAFTFSRAGYLAFAGGIILMGFLTGKIKRAIFLIILLISLVMFLPKPAGEGVNLARTYSISSRLQNYSETLKIFGKSPLFGIGFNNICLAKEVYLSNNEAGSHSCSGSDSSLLLILATTGIAGLVTFLHCVRHLFFSIKKGSYSNILAASSVALFIHSLFTNSLFYPFVMGYFAILISLQDFKEKN